MTSAALEAKRVAGWRDAFAGAARTLSVLTLIGAACGVFVVGILARLAMLVLASLNPSATGVTSDDGFVMGQFTLSGSAQLALSGLQFGVLGAACYFCVRGLLVGPPWFRLCSISLGPSVVIGAVVVHTDGVDFRLLEPVWLAVAMFVALPATFCALLHVLGERVLARWHPRQPLLWLGLVPWVILFPVTLLLAAGLAVHRGLGLSTRGRAFLASPWPGWALRGVLAMLFLIALSDLHDDLVALS